MANCPKIMVVAGVSGAGKTTLIHAITHMDSRFQYIRPYTTRGLRAGETDKVHVSTADLARLQRQGKLLVVNHFYGALYGTPRRPLQDALLNQEVFPVLDWPIAKIGVLQSSFPGKVHCVYVRPPSMEVLTHRLLVDRRDVDGDRLRAAGPELSLVGTGRFDAVIDHQVQILEGTTDQVARQVCDAYYRACGIAGTKGDTM